MSGGEVLGAFAAAASISQLITYTLQASRAVNTLYKNFQDAPSELRRIEEKLLLLQHSLEFFGRYLAGVNDAEVFPPDLQVLLSSALSSSALIKVADTVTRMQNEYFMNGQRRLRRKRDRIKFAISDRDVLNGFLVQLRDAETTLILITLLFNKSVCNSLHFLLGPR